MNFVIFKKMKNFHSFKYFNFFKKLFIFGAAGRCKTWFYLFVPQILFHSKQRDFNGRPELRYSDVLSCVRDEWQIKSFCIRSGSVSN